MSNSYPTPRYPKLKRPKSIEDLMPMARDLVNQPPGHIHTVKPYYRIKSGDKILFVVNSEYHPMVIEAMYRAMREKGARVDLFVRDSTPVAPPEELAAHEAIAMEKDEGDYNYYYTGICDLIRPDTARAMVNLDKYTMVIAGAAGPLPQNISFPWFRFNFGYLEDWAGPMINFPRELKDLIDVKVFNQIRSCKVLELTDPEGTDIKWTNYEDDRLFLPNHILARPINIGYGFEGKDDCTGVVAGTLIHLGAFPNCKAYLEGGQVVKVEGGGKYGEFWQELVKKYKNTKMPRLFVTGRQDPKNIFSPYKRREDVPTYEIKDPGLFWFWEAAIGTVPGAFRLPQEGRFECYGNFLHDRWRAGYIHCGFGPVVWWQTEMIKAGLPWTHVHLHLVFATLKGTTDRGEIVTIIDKGHLTALDDAEVRTLAKKFGNPEELLTETWFPCIPGINVPGDYMKDYGRNPIPWIKKEAIDHPVWID